MSILFRNAKLVLEDCVKEGWLLTNNSVIEKIGFSSDCPKADEVVDCKGQYLAPGFIDMHTHGAGGHDFMDGTVEAFKGACLTHLAHGTTSICPTGLTSPDEELLNLFNVYRQVKNEWKEGPNFLGLHLEGPFFSAEQAGAQDPKYLKKPIPENYMPILEAGGFDIAKMSVACELEGALELGKELKKRGIIAAIGHSDADYAQVEKAVDAGYSLVTHLYSGMSALHRVGPYRVLGVVESSYAFDQLSVEIISDGKHLPPELLKLILKLKDNDKISLITDSMRGAGLEDGKHVLLGSLSHGQDSVIKDGVAMLCPDLKSFAGSVCTTDRCVRTMYKLVGVELNKAVKMITLNPARVLGVDTKKGSLAEGKDADLVIFDDNVNVEAVYVNGVRRFLQNHAQ